MDKILCFLFGHIPKSPDFNVSGEGKRTTLTQCYRCHKNIRVVSWNTKVIGLNAICYHIDKNQSQD